MTNKTKRANVRFAPKTMKNLLLLAESYGTQTTAIAVAINKLAQSQQQETIRLTIEWLDNLERDIGLKRLLDNCPNNWGGRNDLRKLI